MKLDDRDIVCQRDFSPLSAAELMAEIELYTDIALNSPLRDSDPEEILGPARALLARAEAAEADTADAVAAAMSDVVIALGHDPRAFDVAMLETVAVGIIEMIQERLAELEAAAAWHPATEKPPAPGRYSILLGWNLYLDAADYDGIGWGVVWPRYWRERGPLPAAADTEANHD